jgi:hypothetical protein
MDCDTGADILYQKINQKINYLGATLVNEFNRSTARKEQEFLEIDY